MQDYLLLLSPGSNRVYQAQAPRLAAVELKLLLAAISGRELPDVEQVEIAGIDYLKFQAEVEEVAKIAWHSQAFALFAAVADHLLQPIELIAPTTHPSDLITQLKYVGKTNEQFTHLLLVLAAAASARPEKLWQKTLRVLDPVCGRGTTLNTALKLGLSVTGADLDKNDAQQYQNFMTGWLRNHRYKHETKAGALTVNKKSLGKTFSAAFAATKTDYKNGTVQEVNYLNTDTLNLKQVLPKAKTDVIVADLPYGVKHGAQQNKLDRSPLTLLEKAVPVWNELLVPGGAMALAVNVNTAPVSKVQQILQENGMEICFAEPELSVRHRVDAAIDRDVIVAKKPK